MRTTLVLDALRLAHARAGCGVVLVHHSDGGGLGGFTRSSKRIQALQNRTGRGG